MNIICHFLIRLCSVDKQFENVSGLLLKCTTDMLNKYRQLLLTESQVSQSIAPFTFLSEMCLPPISGIFQHLLIHLKDILYQQKLKPGFSNQEPLTIVDVVHILFIAMQNCGAGCRKYRTSKNTQS